MDACSEPETPLTPEDPTPTLATHADIRAGFLKSSRRSAGACAGQSEINVVSRIPFLVNFILGNFAFAMFLISLVTSIVFFAVAWFTVIRDARLMRDQILSNATGVSIFGHSLQLDLQTYVLSISWKVVVCSPPTTPEAPYWYYAHIPDNCKPFDRQLDVYLNDPSKPTLSFTPYTELVGNRLGVLDPPRFTTEHQVDKYGKWDPTQDLVVPFERYSFYASTFAIDPVTNGSVQIATFGILDTLGSFAIRSYDAAGASNFTYESGDGLVTVKIESRVLRAEIERSRMVKALAVCLFIGNWVMTVSSVYTTALVVVDELEANSMIAALPFSALLATPTIRSLYISSPLLEFSFDAVAFFMQIVIVGLCSLVLLRILTGRRQPDTTGSHV